ncbi:MAG: hypothetical protein N3B10_14325, partial [Armatimonadetes bacterium]|nr:hypothetical protein [Armatimonadota bacterium]
GEEVVIVADEKLAVQIGAEGKTELSGEDVKLLKLSSPANVSQTSGKENGTNLPLVIFLAFAVLTVLVLIRLSVK